MAVARTTHLSEISISEIAETCYCWTIHNISFRLKCADFFYSNGFRTSNDATSSWRCLIRKSAEAVHFGLELNRAGNPNLNIDAEFTFAILKSKTEHVLSRPVNKTFGSTAFAYLPGGIFRDDLSKYTEGVGDKLMIVCRVRELFLGNSKNPPCQLQRDLQTVLSNQQFTDVTLVVEGENIKAHKAILSARSPVFAAMFKSDMVELREGQVVIPDMKLKVAQHLLRFIYTGETAIDPDMADQLLLAADKYGLMRLKAQCEQSISRAIDVPTAIKTLLLADGMNAEHLRSQTMAFIKANIDEVMENDDWKTLAEKHPTLLDDVCRYLAKN